MPSKLLATPDPCSRQVGRENNTWTRMLRIPPRFCARNWALRGGETQGVPRGTGKTSARFRKRADLGIIRTPFLRLALRTSGIAHSPIRFGR